MRIGAFFSRSGSFYLCVVALVGLIQLGNLIALMAGTDWVKSVLPPYTHLLALTLGTLFIFRAVQLVGALLWAKLHGPSQLPVPYDADKDSLPFVTVQIPLRNEPLNIARAAIDSALALNYPADRLELQVIDNSDSAAYWDPIKNYLDEHVSGTRQPCAIHFIHRDGTRGYKAGNLNLGRQTARGAFFLILDADSTVPPDTLLNALPSFEDEKTGFVQLRIDPVNENENMITRAAAVTIRARYLTMQVRDPQGLVQFDGHNGIFRAEALNAVGGWAEDISEDLVTSVRVILQGYRGRYLDLPSGELLPTTFNELFKQRKRWAQGTAAFLKREGLSVLTAGNLRWYERLDIGYASINILVEAFIWVMIFSFAPLPALTFLYVLLVMSVLPTLVASPLSLGPALQRQVIVIFVIAAVFPGLVIGAIQGISGRTSGFSVTQKAGSASLTMKSFITVYGMQMLAAVAFFIGAGLIAADLGDYLNSYLPGTIIMSASLVIPLVFNFRPDKQIVTPMRPDPPDNARP